MDYEKAFYRVDCKKLINILRSMGVYWRDRRLIGNLYIEQKIRAKIEGEYSEPWIDSKRGKTRVPTLTYIFRKK